ncbi:MAG: class I SAM-dependent methyltransferase [Nocardiaceae bacterium]|nr:class I SAM-dependent methyltransferase [Nocardiaceae bacterium]
MAVEEAGPSRTALATAYARAYHHFVDEPKILNDHLANRLLGAAEDDVLEREAATLGSATDPEWARIRRLLVVSRARFAEDVIAQELTDGQVVILGAGLDTFGYRHGSAGITVFEVDHPATQEWKRRHLAKAEIEIPESLHFVPVDFETDDLADRLAEAGLDRSVPTVFVWLGVTMYLTEPAVASTLEYVAAHDGPVWLIVDYLPPAGPSGAQSLNERAARVAAVGEPWLSYFTPEAMGALLRRHGFRIVADRSAPDLLAGYGADVSWRADSAAPPHVLCAHKQR